MFYLLATLAHVFRDLVADIFGSSDEDEEFEGFGEADVEATARKKEKKSGM